MEVSQGDLSPENSILMGEWSEMTKSPMSEEVTRGSRVEEQKK